MNEDADIYVRYQRSFYSTFFWLYRLLRENFGAATGGMFSFFPGPESRRDAEEGDGRGGKVGRHSAPRHWTAPTAEGVLISL